jgi:hypothetical protein
VDDRVEPGRQLAEQAAQRLVHRGLQPMSPLEFMQRLAALVPRPRLHLIRLVSASLRCAK